MRYVGIIERLAGGPRYEDAYLASKPRGSASRMSAASAHNAWCRSRYVIESLGQPARVPADLHFVGCVSRAWRHRADQVIMTVGYDLAGESLSRVAVGKLTVIGCANP